MKTVNPVVGDIRHLDLVRCSGCGRQSRLYPNTKVKVSWCCHRDYVMVKKQYIPIWYGEIINRMRDLGVKFFQENTYANKNSTGQIYD